MLENVFVSVFNDLALALHERGPVMMPKREWLIYPAN